MAQTLPSAKVISLRLYLLGAFRIERASQVIALPTRKVESLLAYLALFPEPHSREKLAALLWGDSTDEQARHSLRSALTTLRSKLGDDILLADRETVQINPDYPRWVDAREFQQSVADHPQSAIELYQGDLLADFYDDWIEPERERLRVLYHDSLLQMAQEVRSHSQYARAIELAHKVLASDPANEKAYQHIIFCLAAAGDRIGAIKQYDECQKKLHDELGVEPSQETVGLREQIERELTGAPAREALLTNVPVPLTSFIGRQSELAEIKQLLATTRLLTLTGAGGCGKTRLAIQVATDLAGRDVPAERLYKNGVWWVELASLSDAALVPTSVATVFGLRESRDMPLMTVLTNYCRARQMLLVMDNCEHLIDACARLTDTLLSACPKLQILTTSREALSISGETTFRVPSLACPDSNPLPSIDALQDYAAVHLFVERAAAALPGFGLTRDNAPAIVQVCRQLDGIPLAIELAAARTTVLSVKQIAARLDNRFRLLTSGSRMALPRQQTLRATVDWSYDLLPDDERGLLQCLSVFAGGWTLEAAEAVCCRESGEGRCMSVLELLSHLIDKSLVVLDQHGGEARYRLLETIRQYAREKLDESGETRQARDHHLEYYCQLAEQAEPELQGAEQISWLDRLDAEHDNLRTALAWAQKGGSLETGLCLAGALWRFWVIRGHLREGREQLETMLARPESAGLRKGRAKALCAAGLLAYWLGDDALAHSYLEESAAIGRKLGEPGKRGLAYALHFLTFLARDDKTERRLLEDDLKLFRELGDPWGIAHVFFCLGNLAQHEGDLAEARRNYEESLAIFRSVGAPIDINRTLGRLGKLALQQSNYAQARSILQEVLGFHRMTGSKPFMTETLWLLGVVAVREGDYARAKLLYSECLAVEQEVGILGNFAECSIGLAGVAVAENCPERAARLLGAAEMQVEARGGMLEDFDRAEHQRLANLLRQQLDEAKFHAAWAEGRAMTLEQAIEYALKA